MQYIRLGLLTSILLVFISHSAAHNSNTSAKARELLTEIIKKRSLDSFKEQQSQVQRLEYDDINRLKGTCAAYAEALKVIREMRDNPAIEHEMRAMMQEHNDGGTCLLWLWNLFPNHARQRAIQLAKDTYGTPLGDAMKDITHEFAFLSSAQVNIKAFQERINLITIEAILQQEQNTGK